MRRVVAGIFALTFGLFSYTGTSSTNPGLGISTADADATADDCVGFRKSDLDKGLMFEAASSCDKKLSCSLSWTLTCSTDEGKVTARKPASRSFILGAQESTSETASADSCKQSWRIDDVRWSCKASK